MGWWRERIFDNPMQKWLDVNDVLMYSTHNEVKSIVAKRFIKKLKGKIFQKW